MALTKIVSSSFGAVVGILTGLISSPFLGAWYTYQTTKPKGWNLGFVRSSVSFLPRLLFNVLGFPILGVVGGALHGARSGFFSAWSWPGRVWKIINHPVLSLNLLANVFSLAAPVAPVPVVPAPRPVLSTPMISPIYSSELFSQFEAKDEKSEEPPPDAPQLMLSLTGVNFWTENQFANFAIQMNLIKYTALSLCKNVLGTLSPLCIATLMNSINQSRVKELFLSGTHLGQWNLEQVLNFTHGLASSQLTTLYLSNNNLGQWTEEQLTLLFDAIANSMIQTLVLSSNDLGNIPSRILLPLLSKLKNSQVTSLFLDNNKLGQGVFTIKQFIEFIYGLDLKAINLSCNQLQTASRQWSDDDIIDFMNTLEHMAKINLNENNFTARQLDLFHKRSQLIPKVHAFLMGRSQNPSSAHEEEKGDPRSNSAAIRNHFFHHPNGQEAADKLTRRIFEEFLGVQTLD